MADSTEPDADGTPAADEPADAVAPDAASPVEPASRARRTLDGRTVAIAAVLGIAAALLTILIASALVSNDDTDPTMQLQDTQALLNEPMKTVKGTNTDLASFRTAGKPMLVNLWQSSCGPCLHEMPLLEAAQADNPDVTFVGVATQEPSVPRAVKLAKQTGITYPWALDPDGEVYYRAKGEGMPTTLLLDGNGVVVDTKAGPFKNAKQLQTFIDQAG